MFSKISYLALVILPTLWVLALPTTQQSRWGRASTVESLKLTELAIAKFKAVHKRLPNNLAEVRAFLRAIKIPYSPYDNYGQRLQYVKVSESEYFLKSFDPEAARKIGVANDLSKVKIQVSDPTPTSLEPSSTGPLSIYPAPALLGLKSPKRNIYARLVLEEKTESRRLIVLHGSKKNYVQAAFHDRIEEFFWLKSGVELVFSASGSERYKDGIYHWNLKTNVSKNLLESAEANHFSNSTKKYYYSLSSVDEKDKIHALIYPAHSPELDPQLFYKFKSMITIQRRGKKWTVSRHKQGPGLFEFHISQNNQLSTENPIGNKSQREWLQLPLTGPIETVLEDWQDFCASHSGSPIFSYCLWWLSSLYNDAYKYSLERNPEQAHTIKSYAIEVTQLLDNDISAPEYLRAMGFFLKNKLESGHFATYNVSEYQD